MVWSGPGRRITPATDAERVGPRTARLAPGPVPPWRGLGEHDTGRDAWHDAEQEYAEERGHGIGELSAADRHEPPEVAEVQQAIQSLEEQLAALKSHAPEVQPASGSLDLPQAKAGECYARVFVPPSYQTKTEKLLKAEASERVEVIPASYQWTEDKVLVQEASERVEVIPATYKTIDSTVLCFAFKRNIISNNNAKGINWRANWMMRRLKANHIIHQFLRQMKNSSQPQQKQNF